MYDIKIKRDYVFWDVTNCSLGTNVPEEPAALKIKAACSTIMLVPITTLQSNEF